MTSRHSSRWYQQLGAIYTKGYEAGKGGASIEDCPYNPSSYVKGVQSQRIRSWKRGCQRAIDGKPIYDGNG